MDRTRYLEEIANDANSIVTDARLEATYLNCGIDLTSTESAEIDRISDNTVRSGNWAEWTLLFSRNVAACDEIADSMPTSASDAITHIAFHAYRADLIAAVSAFSDDEIAEIYGWCRCEKCDDWHEDENEAAKCCGAECAWCGEDTDGSEHCSEECAREAAADEEDDDADADDATDDERGLACWEDGEI